MDTQKRNPSPSFALPVGRFLFDKKKRKKIYKIEEEEKERD